MYIHISVLAAIHIVQTVLVKVSSDTWLHIDSDCTEKGTVHLTESCTRALTATCKLYGSNPYFSFLSMTNQNCDVKAVQLHS